MVSTIMRLYTVQVEARPSQFHENFVECREILVSDFLPVENFKKVHAGRNTSHINFGVHKPKKRVSLGIKLQRRKSDVLIIEC